MDSVHDVDISWMSKQHSHSSALKDHSYRPPTTIDDATLPTIDKEQHGNSQANNPAPTTLKPIPHRPGFSRSVSTEKTATLNGGAAKSASPNASRRNSWLSSISSKFSSSPGAHGLHPANTPPASPVTTTPPAQEPTSPPLFGHKVALLSPGIKSTGDAPYTPAPPPKLVQPNFLQSALRRLSSSSGAQLVGPGRVTQHGLCERKVLNVDRRRERCSISELDQSKLRRVAFCVDVEIASGPRYIDDPGEEKTPEEKKRHNRIAEKAEAEALKNPEVVKKEKEGDFIPKATGAQLPKEPVKEASESTTEVKDDAVLGEKDTTRKKEKKKRSEEERKARKEKKRRVAEANGTVPVELVRNDSDSDLAGSPPGPEMPKPSQASPTTDPVRIYRRCCQLRETPILKKITEQLAALTPGIGPSGVVSKLDLTDYWLQLPDLVTLGDYLAVVPVKELIMENCGLSDEGVRVILAGLLAAKCPDYQRKKFQKAKEGEVPQGGFVERVVFKNNSKIGREGWRYICLFINMCRSLKCLDLSKVPFPQPIPATTPPAPAHGHHLNRTLSATSSIDEISSLLEKALGERLAGKELELLNMAECGITTDQLGSLVDGVIRSGLRRLGIAGNDITPEGIHHVARYIRDGKCEGLDLGGNDMKDQMGVISDALDENNSLYALSLADCNLTPDSLWTLFPALAKLKNFRFIDLSQNHDLFETQPSALSLLRRYMPKMPTLKRIHLTDVSMTPEQAIALAEILPESPNLAHVNILENPLLAALANAKDEANQEEACALYASLMAAVRVSKTIICIGIEVPSSDSSEIVKALAKQVVAYCLWNMERGPVAEIQEAAADLGESHGGEKEVAVPDVLLHLVGHVEGNTNGHDNDEPAPDDDYVIGGTGVVKALGICLRNRGNDSRVSSSDCTSSDKSDAGSGSATPKPPVSGGKAKDMSKNLLGSARKIRARLQPTLVKESRASDRSNYLRLMFLDQTLEGMINRFEDEFPETRLPEHVTSPPLPDISRSSPTESLDMELGREMETRSSAYHEQPTTEPHFSDDEGLVVRPVLSRHNSDVSLASRALSQEEGRMHRFGHKFRENMLKSETEDHGPVAREQPEHIQLLRAMIEGMGGEEIRRKLEDAGEDAVMAELNNDASVHRQALIELDPEAWEQFKQSHEQTQRNKDRTSGAVVENGSAVEWGTQV